MKYHQKVYVPLSVSKEMRQCGVKKKKRKTVKCPTFIKKRKSYKSISLMSLKQNKLINLNARL